MLASMLTVFDPLHGVRTAHTLEKIAVTASSSHSSLFDVIAPVILPSLDACGKAATRKKNMFCQPSELNSCWICSQLRARATVPEGAAISVPCYDRVKMSLMLKSRAMK